MASALFYLFFSWTGCSGKATEINGAPETNEAPENEASQPELPPGVVVLTSPKLQATSTGCPDNYGIVVRGQHFATDAFLEVRFHHTEGAQSPVRAQFTGTQLQRWTEDGEDFLYFKTEEEGLKQALDSAGLWLWVENQSTGLRGGPIHVKRHAPSKPVLHSLELAGEDRYLLRLTGREFAADPRIDMRFSENRDDYLGSISGPLLSHSCDKEKTVLEFLITDAEQQSHLNRHGLYFWVVNPPGLPGSWNGKPEKIVRAFHVKGLKPLNIFEANEDFVFEIVLQGQTATELVAHWTVTDYFERLVDSGTAILQAGQWKTQVNLGPLETGHHVVHVEVPGKSVFENFAVVTPYAQRRHLGDLSPFAVHTAFSLGELVNMSWTPALAEPYARAVQLSGVGWIRELMVKNTQQTEIEGFDSGLFDRIIHAFSSKDIKILNFFYAWPRWVMSSESEALGNKLPDNLMDVYRLAKNAGAHYADKITMWEILNEPEVNSNDGNPNTGNSEGPDKYAAFLKAAAIGFHHSGAPNPLVTVGGLVASVHKGFLPLYTEPLFENGIVDYIDVYNFHNHQGNVLQNGFASFIVEKNEAHLKLKNRLPGAEAMPVWLTEAGGGIQGSPNGLETLDKQKAQARFWVTSAAIALSTGVDKHFWFCGPPYYEDGSYVKDMYWGSFSPMDPASRYITPYAAYVAQAVMTEALGEAKYIRKLSSLPEGASGYAFMDNGDTVLILWAQSAVPVSLNLQAPRGIQTDIMGKKTELLSSHGIFNLSLDADPVYLRVPGNVYGLPANAPKIATSKTLTSAQKIVLEQTFMETASRTGARETGGYYFVPPNETASLRITVYNFNPFPVTGTVSGELDMEGYNISGPQTVSVEAEGKAELAFSVSTAGNVVPARLSFVGDFDVGQTTPSVTYVKTTLRVDELGSPTHHNACDNLDTWSLFPTGQQWQIADGLTHLASTPLAPYAYLHRPALALRNGIVSTQVELRGPTSSSIPRAGLGLRRNNVSENLWYNGGYFVLVRADNILHVYKGSGVHGVDGKDIIAPMQTPVSTHNAKVELSVVMQENRFDVFLDGHHVVRFYDDEYASGFVGPMAATAQVSFNHFRVFSR